MPLYRDFASRHKELVLLLSLFKRSYTHRFSSELITGDCGFATFFRRFKPTRIGSKMSGGLRLLGKLLNYIKSLRYVYTFLVEVL